jgi:hypothetical protein
LRRNECKSKGDEGHDRGLLEKLEVKMKSYSEGMEANEERLEANKENIRDHSRAL